ncbi:MAG: hypothetical protein ACYTGH_05340 [Planctomycetota bacterium]
MSRWIACVVSVCLLTGTLVGAEIEWVKKSWKEYGLSMRVPKAMKMATRESRGGWGELYGEVENVQLYVLSKLGEQATEDDIVRFARKEIGTKNVEWELEESGTNLGGWTWYKAYTAVKGKHVYLCGMGTGPKGSYFLYLRTTIKSYKKHEAQYEAWYASLKLLK